MEADADRDVLALWRQALAGKIVLVADVTTGSNDIGPIPVDNHYPLSGVHASVIRTILSQAFLREISGLRMLLVEGVLMVFFGDPQPDAEHALHGVQAAIAMQQAVARLNRGQASEADFQIRIGIHTGLVLVGNMGSSKRLSYTVLGSAVNLAQRLESNAPPGGILHLPEHPRPRQTSDSRKVRRSHCTQRLQSKSGGIRSGNGSWHLFRTSMRWFVRDRGLGKFQVQECMDYLRVDRCFAAAAKTCSGRICCMHSPVPMGQVRLKQGLQATPVRTIRCCFP